MLAEHGDDFFRLVHPHQAMVNQNTRELIADCLMNQKSCNRRIYPAGQSANNTLVAHLLSDGIDGLLAVRSHGPIAFEPCNIVNKIRDQLGALRCVHHFGMEHGRIIFARFINGHGAGCVG